MLAQLQVPSIGHLCSVLALINELCRITRVGAPKSNQATNQQTNQQHNVIFTNIDVCHCSVFNHSPVPELGKYEVQLDKHLPES